MTKMVLSTPPPAIVLTVPAADQDITAPAGTWIRFRVNASQHVDLWGIGNGDPPSGLSITPHKRYAILRGRLNAVNEQVWISAFNLETGSSGSTPITVDNE